MFIKKVVKISLIVNRKRTEREQDRRTGGSAGSVSTLKNGTIKENVKARLRDFVRLLHGYCNCWNDISQTFGTRIFHYKTSWEPNKCRHLTGLGKKLL